MSSGPLKRTLGVRAERGGLFGDDVEHAGLARCPGAVVVSVSAKMLVRICLIVASRVVTVSRMRRGLVVVEGGGDALQGQTGAEQLFDDVVVQVGGDAVAVIEQREQLLLGAGVGELDGDAGLVGECGEQASSSVVNARRPASPYSGEHPVHLVGAEHGREQHRADVHLHRGRAVETGCSSGPGEQHRLAAGEHLPRQRAIQRQAHAPDPVGVRAVGDRDMQGKSPSGSRRGGPPGGRR